MPSTSTEIRDRVDAFQKRGNEETCDLFASQSFWIPFLGVVDSDAATIFVSAE